MASTGACALQPDKAAGALRLYGAGASTESRGLHLTCRQARMVGLSGPGSAAAEGSKGRWNVSPKPAPAALHLDLSKLRPAGGAKAGTRPHSARTG